MANISFGFENPLKTRFGESFFKELPREPGVYTFLNSRGQPLYIGKANNLKARLMSYQAAKPGQAPDHILEMIEHAHDLKFELRKNESDALRREEELIRAVRPLYNVALNYDVSYLYIAFKRIDGGGAGGGVGGGGASRVEFRLSHFEVGDGFTTFGCFRHRGKAKAAYSALMRLLFAAFCPRERFQIPSRICRSSPAYQYTADVDETTLELIEEYLSGRSSALLKHFVDAMLSREHFPKQLYLPMQRDLDVLKEFFAYGPQDTARLAKRLRLRSGIVSQERMDRAVASDYSRALARS